MKMCLALAVLLAAPLAGASAASEESSLDLGIRQVKEGDFSKAVMTLDAVIQELTPEASAHAKELSQGWLYKGIALVGLLQEEPAKAAFREALRHDPTVRLRKGEQPDRVVRVFDAARTGKTKAVLERPSDAPKKAGLGAGAIAAIVAGGVALAGGVAAAAGGGGSQTVADGIALLNATPASGSTVSLRLNAGCSFPNCSAGLGFSFSVTSATGSAGYPSVYLHLRGRRGAEECLAAVHDSPSGAFGVNAGQTVTVSVATVEVRCAPPFTIDSLRAYIESAGTPLLEATFPFSATLNP